MRVDLPNQPIKEQLGFLLTRSPVEYALSYGIGGIDRRLEEWQEMFDPDVARESLGTVSANIDVRFRRWKIRCS